MTAPTASDYPVQYRADHEEKRSRLTTFFRGVMLIPLYFTMMLWGFLGLCSLMASWFALMFTGRYPQSLYEFNAGVLRHITRVNAYASLATDQYPPFDTSEAPTYPVRVAIAAPQRKYSRVKVFFRGMLVFPFAIVSYALMIVSALATFAAWFVIVVTGRQPAVVQEGINLGLSYQTKVNGFYWMLTDAWPLPITDGAAVPAVSHNEPLGAA